jgi:hypothetical protein
MSINSIWLEPIIDFFCVKWINLMGKNSLRGIGLAKQYRGYYDIQKKYADNFICNVCFFDRAP